MSDLLKRLLIGGAIGLAISLLIGLASYQIPFIKNLLDGYEFLSYDGRMRARTTGVEQMSIEDVVIIDIDNSSVAPIEEGGLGHYFDWPQAYHGRLINTVSSGNPDALLFDIIFDKENSFNYDLVNALTNENAPKSEALVDVTGQYLISNDPSLFLDATYSSQKAYHALVFEQEDTLNFLYKMETEPEGYFYDNHIIAGVSDLAKERLPKADRIGNTYVDLLSASVGAGSANFPQDEDGIIRRAPTAIYFEGPDHVFPSLVMSAAIDILGIKKDGGFDYDFDNNILRLIDTTDTVVREIPIDDHGNMFVNFYGLSKTFYYISYMYSFDPEMLPPNYWQDKVALVGTSLAGLFDLRNTPVQETFPGVEIHANVIRSILKNEFVTRTGHGKNFLSILIIILDKSYH